MSLSELWSLYGQNYIDALLATWGMTLSRLPSPWCWPSPSP